MHLAGVAEFFFDIRGRARLDEFAESRAGVGETPGWNFDPKMLEGGEDFVSDVGRHVELTSYDTAWSRAFLARLIDTSRKRCYAFYGMGVAIQVQIEELPEGLFLATSDELQGLVAQGRTAAEALEIARDVARSLLEVGREQNGIPNLPTTSTRRDYTFIVAA